MKQIQRLTLILSIFLVGCGINLKWIEEVQLKSGEILLIKRTAKGEQKGEIGGSGGWDATEMTLELESTPKIGKPPVWHFPYVPILMDYDDVKQEWFVVATFYYCTAWYDLGRPKLPYIEYRARGGKWEVVPLSAELFDRETNLLTGPRSGGEPKLVKLDEKNTRNKRADKSFRWIVRNWTTGC